MDEKIREAFRSLTMRSPAERLEKVLLDNRESFTINSDGSVTVDYNSPKVQERIQKHFEILRNFKISPMD